MPESGAIEEDFNVTVTVSIVAVPPQTPLETTDAGDFMHPLSIPGFDLADGNFIVVSVHNTDDDQEVVDPFFDAAGGTLQRNRTGDTPPPVVPGNYLVYVEATHPDIRGPVTITISVAVRGALNPATHNLSAPADPILVAPGYAGNLRLQAPANISLAQTAEADAAVSLPASFPSGVSLELNADETEITPYLTDPLAPAEALEAVLTVTIARANDLYLPLEQLITLAVSALALPAVAEANIVAAAPQNIFAAGGEIINLAAPEYENGVYNGAAFQQSGVSPQLDVNLAGIVTAAADLPIGEYAVTVVALGRQQTDAAQFVGEVQITVSVQVERGRETINPDDIVPAADRALFIDAVVGYTGDGHTITLLSDDYQLTDETWDSALFAYDAANNVIQITTAVSAHISYAVTASASCAAASGRLCNTIDIAVTANFSPVSAPPQEQISANYLDAFAHAVTLPSGYKTGEVKEDGRNLNLIAVDGWTGDLSSLSLSIDGETLQYAPENSAENALTPGQYTIALEMTQTDLLGALSIQITANINRRPLDPAEYGLSEPATIIIAQGPSPVGLSVGVATLTGGAPDATIALPATFPSNISLALNENARGFAIYISDEFQSKGTTESRVIITVSRPDENYAPAESKVTIFVRALPQPALIEESVVGVATHEDANVANLKTGDLADATLFAKVDEESDAELLVDPDTGIISTDGELGEGTYNIVVAARSPAFFGEIRLTLNLVISPRVILLPTQTIPTDQRSQNIPVVAGYAGSVAYFVASSVGVTLQTPDPAPAGFNFGANAAGVTVVSPVGFTLFADQLDDGERPANFVVAATLAEHEGENITLNITVSAVAAPNQDELAAAQSTDYEHALNLPDRYQSGGQLQIIGVHDTVNNAAITDADQRLTIDADNKLQPVGADPAARLAVGRYLITVEMTHPNFLGAMNLLITADIQQELLPANVVADREPSQLVAVGHSGEGYEIPVAAEYTLANAAYDENQFTLALDYELQILNPMPNSDLAATLAADVLCVDETSRSCAPLRISLTIAYNPLSPPMLERTERVTVAGSGVEYPYNDPNIADLKTESADFANATFAKVDAESSPELLVNADGTISTDGDLFVGAYTLFADATSPDFLGTARASLGLTVRGILNPAANNNHYGIQGPDVNPLLVAPGYAGDLQELAARVYLRGNAPSRARVVLPSESPAGITLRHGASNAIAVPHLTIALAPEETLVAVLTLTVERDGVDNPELYDKLPQLKTITVSALAFPEPALATVAARPAPVNTFAADEIIVSLDTNAYADGFYSSARFVEHADASPDLNVGQDIGQSGGVSAQRDLAVGAYEFTVLARGDTGVLHNTSHPNAQRFFHGTVTIAVSVDIVRGAEIIAPDDYIPAADRDANIDSAVGYSGDGYAIPLASDDYELTDEEWDTAAFDYNAADEVIQITTPIADDPVSYTVIAQANCTEASGRLCAPVAVTITATFTPVSAPFQIDIPGVYLSDFAGAISFPPGYETGGPNSAGRALAFTSVEGHAGDIANLSLSFNDDVLEYAPNGVAANALNVGEYTVAFEMTQPDLLGAVPFEVAVDISQRPLVLADYGFSEAPVVAVAPGASAVGQSIAAFALTGGADDAQVALPDEANFPAKLSLSLSADNRGFAVYVSAPFTSEEVAVHNIPLTVTRPGGNYAPLPVPAPLTVGALRQPPLIERSASGLPYNDQNLANLKTGVFINATFAKADAESDAELTVNSDGVVSTNGDLNAAGTYDIAVDATSPDFVGSVRFALQLVLTDRRILLPANTIPTDDRSQEIAVVAGYAGSVAFFVATDEGVTLQTPAAPSGFNFGANGANANFVSPVGFTLFVDQLNSGQAAANFQVAAALAEHDGEDITLNITVIAVEIPDQAALNALNTAADYGHSLNEPAAYPFTGGQLQIIGVHNTGADSAVADHAARIALANNNLQPVDAADPAARLAAGQYEITVEFTHAGFLGAMNLVITANIQEELFPDNVIADRVVTQPIAVGHSGEGYTIPVSAGYALTNHEFNFPSAVNLDGNELEVVNPLNNTANNLVIIMTADVTCDDATRNCAPLKITLTVTYAPVDAPAQTAIDNAQYLTAFTHPLNLPSGYETGGANETGRSLNITGVNGWTDDLANLSLAVSNDDLTYAPEGVAANALNVGQYTITVEMAHSGLLGIVTMEVTANISRAQLDPAVYFLPHLGSFDTGGIRIVAGAGGNDALIGVPSLSDTTGATISGFTTRNFIGTLADDNRGISVRTRTNANYGVGQEEYAAFTVTVTRGDPNYADLIVVLSIGVGPAFAVPARLELSAQTQSGETTYTNNNIANFSEGAYSRLSGGNFTKNEPGDTTKLEVDKDTGIISGNDLGLGTHTITVEVTSNNFIGTAQAELILTVESPPPNPDNVVANRQISQPIAVGHSGDPGYVIPIAANYTLANPQYDETQITIANGNEIRLATPMPNSNLVAALTADAQCITQTGDCGALKITITATFTPVSTGTFLNLILPNRTDPFGTHRVPRPAGYPNAAVAITLTSHLGILRHDGTQVETLAPAFAFFALDSNDDLIQGPDGFPDAGTHGIGFSVTDPGYLGAVAVVGAVTSPANNLGPEFALAQTEATVTVAPGFAGMVYQTTLQTENGVIGSPYIVAPDSGFSAGLLGDTTLAGSQFRTSWAPGRTSSPPSAQPSAAPPTRTTSAPSARNWNCGLPPCRTFPPPNTSLFRKTTTTPPSTTSEPPRL